MLQYVIFFKHQPSLINFLHKTLISVFSLESNFDKTILSKNASQYYNFE
jgi:hypothetical protein